MPWQSCQELLIACIVQWHLRLQQAHLRLKCALYQHQGLLSSIYGLHLLCPPELCSASLALTPALTPAVANIAKAHKRQFWIFISVGSIWGSAQIAPSRADQFSVSRLLEAYSDSWQSVSRGDPRCRQLKLPLHTATSPASRSYVQHAVDRPGTPPADGFNQGSICHKEPGIIHR